MTVGTAMRAYMISLMLETNYRYLCFAGLVMLQLAVPKLRSTSALKAFSKSFQACKCELDAWRERERLAPAQAALLDADDGAGWELAQALLRPRKLEVRVLTDFSTMLPSRHFTSPLFIYPVLDSLVAPGGTLCRRCD